MSEVQALGPGEQCPLDDAVMGKRIVDDRIPWPEQMPNHRHVGSMTTYHGDTVFGLMQSRQPGFQCSVNRPFARDDSACGGRGTIQVDRFLRRSRDSWITV